MSEYGLLVAPEEGDQRAPQMLITWMDASYNGPARMNGPPVALVVCDSSASWIFIMWNTAAKNNAAIEAPLSQDPLPMD
jgi:hypothetical protein